MIRFTSILSVFLILGATSQAIADSNPHTIANGAGISAPSRSDALRDNPAGLIFNRGPGVLGAAGSENDQFDPFQATGRVLFGSGNVGGAFGLHSYKEGSEDRLVADYGLSAYANSIQTSIGISGSSRLKRNPRPSGDSHDINLGTLVNPGGQTQLGFTLNGVIDGVDYYGMGLSTPISSEVTFSLDGSTNPDLEGTTFKSALGFNMSGLQVSLSYAVRTNDRASNWIRTGFGAGLAFKLGQSLELMGVYNHHDKYYAGFAVNL